MKKYKVRVTLNQPRQYQAGGQPMFTQEELLAQAAGIESAYPKAIANPSVYDYLAAHGQAANADYQSRKKIAQNLGIKNYKGTAEQNLQMLEMLKNQKDLSSLLKEQVAPQSKNKRSGLPTATDPSWNTPMPSPASGMRYIPQPFGAPGNIAPATNNDDSWGKTPVKKSKRSTLPAAPDNSWEDQGPLPASGIRYIPQPFVGAANYGDGWDDAPSVWESIIQGPVFYPNLPAKKGKKQTPVVTNMPNWTRNRIPGDQMGDGWDSKRPFYMPQNIFGREEGGEMMAYGGQSGLGLDLGSRVIDNEMGQPDPYAVKDTLQAVPRDMANLEAERGETAYGDLDNDGEMEHSKIGGKRHSQGGTPLNLQPGTFIYSDTKSMKLKGQALAQFGKSVGSSKGYTPADLAKQYEINKYKAILADPNADQYQKRTAEMMMNNNKLKLAQLALAQEAKKGFPQGIPQAAMMALPPEIAEQLQGMQEPQGMEQSPEAMEYQKRGGSTFSGNAWYQEGGINNPGFKALPDYVQEKITSNMAYGGIHLDPSKKGTFKAQATRMGMSTQEAAAHILANKDEYSPEMVKKANFARNFAKEDGGLVEYQTAGQVQRVPVYSPQDQATLSSLMPNYNVGMPLNARTPGSVPVMQSKTKAGVYGEENWWDAAHQADFKQRFPEFFQNAPTWDPRIPGATRAFQEYVNPQLIAAGLSPLATDDKFGELTYSTPSLTPYNKLPLKKPGLPVNIQQPVIGQTKPVSYWTGDDEAQMGPEETAPAAAKQASVKQVAKKQSADRFSYMTPDKLAMLQSLFTRAGVPTMTPFVQAPDYVKQEAAFADPTRQYAAVAEQANMQNQGLRTFGRPQANLAGASQIAGKQLEAISNIGAATNMQNVGIANQVNATNTALENQNLAQRAQAANMLGEMVNKYNLENFSMRDAADKQTLAAYQNAFMNRAMLDMVNRSNPYYAMDPITGRSTFKGGKNPFNSTTGSSAAGMNTYPDLLAYATKTLGMPQAMAEKWAESQLSGKSTRTTTDSNYDGYPDKQVASMMGAVNPFLAMFGQR